MRLGLVHPAEPWPKPKPQAPQVPTLREFTKHFFAYVTVQKKSGTARFYEVCTNHVLRFSALADALLSEITGEAVSMLTIPWNSSNGWPLSQPVDRNVARARCRYCFAERLVTFF